MMDDYTKGSISMTTEIEEQRPGNNRATKINRKHIMSSVYRRKFDEISDSPELNRLLYQLAKKMLHHRSGTTFEDMYWISPESLETVAEENNGTEEKAIRYSRKTRRTVERNKGLITIHSHPDSFPPSIGDFNSNFYNEYSIGIVVCHDGKVYLYSSNQEVNRRYYDLAVADFIKQGYNECEAQVHALNELMRNFDIQFKDVAY